MEISHSVTLGLLLCWACLGCGPDRDRERDGGADADAREAAELMSDQASIQHDSAPEMAEEEVWTDGAEQPDFEVAPDGHDPTKPVCEGSVLIAVRDGAHMEALDCSAQGWTCKQGTCIAAQSETKTEAEWRQRLIELSVENALAPMELDSFGGWVNAPESLGKPAAAAFFTVQKLNGRWWFVTPQGHLFLSKGVTDVNIDGHALTEADPYQSLQQKYGSEEEWVSASVQRMDAWAFNTVGPWSSYSALLAKPQAGIIMDSAGHAPRYPGTVVTDMWSQGFADHCVAVAEERAGPWTNDANVLGHFLDNELVWEPNWATSLTLLQNYMAFPADAPGRAEALAFLKANAATITEFNNHWGTSLTDWTQVDSLPVDALAPTTPEADKVSKAFAVYAFKKYAETAVPALKAVDPNHLVLGCRFHTFHWDELMIEAGKHFDVVSLAYYSPEPPTVGTDRVAEKVGKPFLVEEFSFKAEDSGYWNVMNYAPVVKTQKDRALAYDGYVRDWMSRPYAVAFHWYKWFDNPTKADNIIAGDNFGLMRPNDEPYLPLVTLMAQVNRQVESWHASGF